MPELPEVEHIRRRLTDRIVGRRVDRVTVRRDDVVRNPVPRSGRSEALLRGGVIATVHRHGKRLAIESGDGRVVEFGLGMSGAFLVEPIGSPPAARGHRHVIWTLDSGNTSTGPLRLVWRDPRRFGGLWPWASRAALLELAWGRLGPDALLITPRRLQERLSGTERAVKTALLDQKLVAGVGNIYADEALHAAGIAPMRTASGVRSAEIGKLVRALKRILRQAAEEGGSTIRDHRGPDGLSGSFQSRHAVYGRPDEPCEACGTEISLMTLGGRSTHWCETCQC